MSASEGSAAPAAGYALLLSPPLGERCDHFAAVVAALSRPGSGPSIVAPAVVLAAERDWPRRGLRQLRDDVAAMRELLAVVTTGDGSDPPTVLLGASYGGLVVRAMLAEAIATGDPIALRVAGAVLVDAVHEGLYPAVRAWVGPDADERLDDPEGLDLDASFAWARGRCPPGCLSQLPLAVLARGGLRRDELEVDARVPAMERMWQVHQRMLTMSSSRATFRRVVGAGHLVAVDRPDAVAAAVAGVVRESGVS